MTFSAKGDPVALAIEQANWLLDSSPDQHALAAFVEQLEELSPRDLTRLDWQARSWYSGVEWAAVDKLRWPSLSGSHKALWEALALVSGDGHVRESAARSVSPTPLSARLLVLRCLDWVQQVRDAALTRVDELPHDLLVEVLPLAEQLATERKRGAVLVALLDARLSDDDLRSAARAEEALVRRAAWRRLTERGAASADELTDIAARDTDVLVRAAAAGVLGDLPADGRRRLAWVLINDRVGWIAAPALAALVGLDGERPIRQALVARTAPVRRAAQGWATIHAIDARAVYTQRLSANPEDPIALQALTDLADARDADVFRRMLTDPRSRIRAAGLRALARTDQVEARAAALDALRGFSTGRVTWAAADVLRDGAPSSVEANQLAALALEDRRTPGQRFRILSILRPAGWLHLATVLKLLRAAQDDPVRQRLLMEVDAWRRLNSHTTRGPGPTLREDILVGLGVLDERRRQSIEFLLRTST